MADQVLSALITILMRKSADLLAQRIGMMWGIDDQCKKLHDKLLAVQDVITDAEEQGEAKPAVKSWLANLKSAAYDADDVLDEFRYEELRQDAVKRGHKAGKGIVWFSGLFRFKMSRKLKDVVGRIDDLVTEMKTFEFVQGRKDQPVIDRVKTHSYVIESEVVGRGEDKEELVKLLTEASPTNILTVLPIVGMGGLGKTTLAQMVYNDPRVKEHFKLLIWVCVSEKFEVLHLIRLIIDTVIKKDSEVPRDNMELLQNRLRQEIGGQRYLLVLDDVWNDKEDRWDQLRVLLNCGDLGSTVLVTTRNVTVASIMGAVQSNNLGCLGEEDSWDLFRKRAFTKGIKERLDLVEIGKNLVQNCGGLPLAIKTLGGLMSNKHDVREWSAVLEQSKTWKHKLANNEVLPILRLSYDHLPSYVKQCFAFCAVFPKDFGMVKEELVQYWMANGFIPSEMPGNLEMTGSDIFDELAWRSFFQDVKFVLGEHGYESNRTTCKMHDLMHDLAQSVMRDECLSLQESSQIHNTPQCNVRHISWDCLPVNGNKAIECFPAARSLIFNEIYHMLTKEKIKVPKSNSLRVLKQYPKTLEIPFGKLKHLRYLNLSNMDMKTLPDAITTLYLLQTFRLYNCYCLSELPKGMRYMMSLRHLYIEGLSKLQCMPPSLGELKFLQTLSYYIVGIGEGNKIGDLNTLNLGGQLAVYNLREVSDVRDAKEANMASKQNLDRLILCWGMRGSSVEDVESNGSKTIVVDPCDVLDALKPCSKLKALEIKGYIGDKFPIWMTEYHMLENLVELRIIECRRCTNLPPLHRLPLLQVLHIKGMDNLRQLCCGVFMSAEDGEVSAITFPSLKSFELHKMANLDCWYEGDIGDKSLLTFPVLSYLEIMECPKLSAIPVTPLLKKMVVQGNKTLSNLTTGITTIQNLDLVGSGENLSFKPWVSLEKLRIHGFNHIIPPTIGSESEELSVDVNTTALLELRISSCNFWVSPISSNSSLWVWKCFRFVEVLEIEDCDSFTSWPEEELSNLIYLRKMDVSSCTNFLGSPSEPLSETPTRHSLLPKLKDFTIYNCPKMAEIPKLPRSLEKLKISGCPKLECLPEWLGSLVALKQLEINLLESLNSFPSSIGCLIALETLHIGECINLSSLPEGMQGLEALKDLQISCCPKIRILPEGLLQRLRSPDDLWIRKCPLLEKWISERRASTRS
ncbi:putative disease resistance protein RGA4 [Carex rostrata]